MHPKKMRKIEGWIEELKAEFKVNTTVARAEARDRKYTLANSDVMTYYYAKSSLLRTANEEISRKELIDEVWLDLPLDFRLSLRHNEVKSLSLSEFSHVLRDVDVSYREKKKAERREKKRFRDRSRERDRERTRDRDRDRDRTRDDRKKDREYSKSTTTDPRTDLHKGSDGKRKDKDEKNGRRDKKKRIFQGYSRSRNSS